MDILLKYEALADVAAAQALAAAAHGEAAPLQAGLDRAGVPCGEPRIAERAAAAMQVLQMPPNEAQWRRAIAERAWRAIVATRGASLQIKPPAGASSVEELVVLLATLRAHARGHAPTAPPTALGGAELSDPPTAVTDASGASTSPLPAPGTGYVSELLAPLSQPCPPPPLGSQHVLAAGGSDIAELMPYLLEGEPAELLLESHDYPDDWVDCTVHKTPSGREAAAFAAAEGLCNHPRRACTISGDPLNAACAAALDPDESGAAYTVHVHATRRYDYANGHSGRLLRGVEPYRLRRKTAPGIRVGGSYESRDAHRRWWPVTVKGENVDGTYSLFVHDGTYKKMWPCVHAANIRARQRPHRGAFAAAAAVPETLPEGGVEDDDDAAHSLPESVVSLPSLADL